MTGAGRPFRVVLASTCLSALVTAGVSFAGPAGAVVRCGRYRILDWRRAVLPVVVGGPILPPHPPTTTDGTAPKG